MQNYTIFYKNAIIYIGKFLQKTNNAENIIRPNAINDIKSLIKNFLEKEKNIIISCEKQKEAESVFENIKACFDFHKAAGGVVQFDGKILVISKYNKYDLPKGHVEYGETDKETALREVEEETGVKNLNIVKDLAYTYYIFPQKNDFALKQTHWYAMTTDYSQMPVAQNAEGIESAIWLDEKDVNILKLNTYPSILEVLKQLGV